MSIFVLEAPGSVTVRSINQFSQDLLAAVETHDEVIFDLSNVSEMDLSLVQVIEAARAHSLHKSGSLRLSEPAGAGVTALLDRAGFLTDAEPADLDFWFHGSAPQ